MVDKQLLGQAMLWVLGGLVSIVVGVGSLWYACTHFGETFWYSMLGLVVVVAATVAVYEVLWDQKRRREHPECYNKYGNRIA